jgi:hypothetical protein
VERTPLPLCARKPPTVQQVMEAGKCIIENPRRFNAHSRSCWIIPVWVVTV